MLPALAFFLIANTQTKVDVADVVDGVRDSIVYVETDIGSGSGVIVSIDGLVVTNAHVLSGAKTAFVKRTDGAIFNAVGVVGVDETRDLALLKLDARGLKPAVLGNSKSLRVGNSVLAVGAPRGLEFSVTDGIVSAIREREDNTSLIQTSAPISPGSSGGALVDSTGAVVGITTFFLRESQALNFAVDVKHVHELIKSRSSKSIPIAEAFASRAPELESSDEPVNEPKRSTSVWVNLADQTEYEIRITENYVYARYLPTAEMESAGVSMACEYIRSPSFPWSGKCSAVLPAQCLFTIKKCQIETEEEISTLSSERITGFAENPTAIDCNCRLKGVARKPWTMIPK